MGSEPLKCPECKHVFSVKSDFIDDMREDYFSDDNNWMFEYVRCGRESIRNKELIEENTQLRGDMMSLSKTKEDLRAENEYIDKIIKKYEDIN